MNWSELVVGDIVSFTDEFKKYYTHKGVFVYSWISEKLLTISNICIDTNKKYSALYFKEVKEGNLGFPIILQTGRYFKDENSPVVFEIVELKED